MKNLDVQRHGVRLLTGCAAVLAFATSAVAFATTACAQTTDLSCKTVKFIGDTGYENCWKIANPSGPSDYFNNDYDLLCAGNTIVAIAADVCETSPGGSNGTIGAYYDSPIDATGHTPDLTNAAGTSAGAGLPGTFCSGLTGYDIPDATLSTTEGAHAVYGCAPGDFGSVVQPDVRHQDPADHEQEQHDLLWSRRENGA